MSVSCPACGHQNADAANFCDDCGSGLVGGCPSCGAENRPGARFCSNCGARLGEEGSAATAATSASAGEPAAAAERRLVSVLFADLVSFTSYSEGRDPEIVRETLNRYFEATREVIERHGGTVEKFIGDAVMAEWGAPRTNEDDAERAVRAALEVVDAVRGLGEGLHARVAVLTGLAAVTLGATDQGMVAGDLVNTAARLQGVAPPDHVLVGEATMQAASGTIAFEEVGEQTLKGKEAPMRAWRAVRVVGDRRGLSEALEPPFVGRELELRLLKDLINTASEERRPRLVSITGPAGIGKSRLAWEFYKYVDGIVEAVYWHRGRSPSYGEGIAFWSLGEMVRRRARLVESDDEATTRDRIRLTVADFIAAPDMAWVEGALLTLLGLEPPPPGGRDALFAAWRTFFERMAARSPTALVFEDLHWADDGTLDFIDHLLEWSRDVPLLVITLARPDLLERRPGWGTRARSFNAIGLEPLTDANMRDLLTGLVPEMSDGPIEQVLARADGIPLYAVEMVRTLIADGRLEPMPGGTYRLTGELGELALPDSLRALVAARLDALDAADRSLIQDATVLGQTFDHRALAAITGQDEEAVEQRLRALVKRELLEILADPSSPERGQFSFVQSVLREVAYDTLSRHDRRARHLAAARHHELTGDEELAAVLATHYLAALRASDDGPETDVLRAQARVSLRGAADRATALGAPEQAVAHLRSALEITDDPGERAELYVRAATAARMAAELDDAVGYAREAVAAYDEAGDRGAVLETTATHGLMLIDQGYLDEAVTTLESADTGADGYPQMQAGLLAVLARAYMRLQRYEDSLVAADRALTIAEPRRLDHAIAEALANKAASMKSLGREREATALLRSAVDLAAEVGDTDLELRTRMNLGAFLSSSDLSAAMRTWHEGEEVAARLGQRKAQLWLWSMITSASVEEGRDWDAASAKVDELLDGHPDTVTRGMILGTRLWFEVLRGQDAAETWAEIEAIRERYPDTDDFMGVPHLRGVELTLAGRFEEAIVALREAIPKMGGNVFEAYGRLLLAALAARDAEALRFVEAYLHAEGQATTIRDAQLRLIEAGLAVIDGRPEQAVPLARESARQFADVGWGFVAAEVKLFTLLMLPGRTDLSEWAQEVRATFERLGARPYLGWLDEMDPAPQPQEAGVAV